MTRRTLEFAIAIVLAAARSRLARRRRLPRPTGRGGGQSSPRSRRRPGLRAARSRRRGARTAARRAPRAPGPTQYTYIDERGQAPARGAARGHSRATALDRLALRARRSRRARCARRRRPRRAERGRHDLHHQLLRLLPRRDGATSTSSGIDYVNRDVEQDDEARAEYLELTGGRRGVPVIVVGDAWMQGWSQPEFDRLLAAATQ